MAMDFDKPALSDSYFTAFQDIRDLCAGLALGLDTPASNVPTGAIRWSSANSRWEKYNGSTWDVLAAKFLIDVDTLDGHHASDFATANLNLCTLWLKFIDANTVQVQPGEVEINGVMCLMSTPTSVTLSGNLEAGQSEAASTYFYLYAKREAGQACSFMFSTTAPLMDRYGNTVASFELCDKDRAWFHPTLGLDYRYIGQVYNKSDSNILAFDKCKPGYWESAWTAIPGYGAYYALNHAAGKVVPMDMRFKMSLSDTNYSTRLPFAIGPNGTVNPIGIFLGDTLPSTLSTAYFYAAPAGGWTNNNAPYGWVNSGGYYKLICNDY